MSYNTRRKDWRNPYRRSRESHHISYRKLASQSLTCFSDRLYHHYRTEQESLAELRAFRRGLYTTPLYVPADENETDLFSYNTWDYL